MYKYPKAREIDFGKFNPEIKQREIRYGLPAETQFCRECVMSNQYPNSTVEFRHKKESKKSTIPFGDDGICDPCKFVKIKNTSINWEERRKELQDLCDKYRRSDGRYDVLVPGSGGKDSFYAAHMLKYEFGMNPLTMTWAPNMYTDWGWENFQAWLHAGFDNWLCTPNGRTHRLLTRLALENIFHPFQPFIIGQKALAPKVAAQHDIPLVFYGENDAEYNNPIADNTSAQRDWKFFTESDPNEVYLGGTSIAELKEDYGLSENDLNLYLPVNPEVLEKNNIEVHYLGYYLKWHPQSCYYYSVEHGNFKPSPERTPGTYSKYNSIDDKIDDLFYYSMFIKFGFGRASTDASQEIRSGDITREEGVALIKKFDGEFPERFIDEIFDYLSINEKQFPKAYKNFETPIIDRAYFENLADSFRSPHIWNSVNGNWQLRSQVEDISLAHAS